MKTPDTSDKNEQRKFGIVMAVAIAVIGLIRWAIHHFQHLPVWFFYVAAAFLIVGLVLPKALQPIFYLWMKFSLALNWLMTRVLLTVAYFLFILPARIALALARKDPLKQAWLPDAPTYWEEPEEQPAELDRYFNQF